MLLEERLILLVMVGGAKAEEIGSSETSMATTNIDKEEEDNPHMMLAFAGMSTNIVFISAPGCRFLSHRPAVLVIM